MTADCQFTDCPLLARHRVQEPKRRIDSEVSGSNEGFQVDKGWEAYDGQHTTQSWTGDPIGKLSLKL